jgi:hypothetical protein
MGPYYKQQKSIKIIRKLTLSFTPYPLFLQSKEIWLNLNMKCWNSEFNAHVGAVKIYVAAVEAFRKKERGDETQFTTKIGGKTSLSPSYFVL